MTVVLDASALLSFLQSEPGGDQVDLSYTVEEAIKHILASIEPLGKEYVEVAARAFNERWIYRHLK